MKKCIVIDTYGFLFRAFHVQPPLKAPDGTPVGAIYGFTSMLIKLLSEQKPTHVIAVFDTGEKNFRHDLYAEYKANRPEIDEDLIKQLPISRKIIDKLNIRGYEAIGYEADDVIATIADRLSKQDEEVIVVSSDKDLAQLITDKVKLLDPVKGRYITEETILDKFGIVPNKIRDYLAIVGDKSDNIPGIPGFGPKTAAELLNRFGSLDSIIENRQQIESKRKKQILEDNIENAKLSYMLAELKLDVPIEVNNKDIEWVKPDLRKIQELIEEYDFKSLRQRVQKICNNDADTNSEYDSKSRGYSDAILNLLKNTKIDSEEDIEAFKKLSQESGYCSLILTHKQNILASTSGKIFQFSSILKIQNIINDSSVIKILFNIKEFNKILSLAGVDINAYADLSIMEYILSAGYQRLNLTQLYEKYLNELPKNHTNLTLLDNYSEQELIYGQICLNMKTLFDNLESELFQKKILFLYYGIDLPLSYVLKRMEDAGVKIDTYKLAKLSEEFEQKIQSIESKVFQITEKEFNISSPKQIGKVLFEDLKLPKPTKKGKSGSLSTNAETLENLSSGGYEVAKLILEYRHFSKLKNTYVDALPKLVNSSTGRLHTTLLQTSTATGRLSSSEPNLQNIPIRTEEGLKVRSAITSENGRKLISADYSQIELRILAEIANITKLKEAFEKSEDIHTKTASEIFSISSHEVTADLRRKAKAINFGIIYGLSNYGLAKHLSISHTEAKSYIEKYFETYPGIKEYMEKTKEFAYKHGYVENYFGRRCYVPLIKSSNWSERNFAQRAAINAPIQGFASDIAKIAMIKIDKMLSSKAFSTRMILQVHDELLFESPEEEIQNVIPYIRNNMENVVDFKPALKVEMNISDRW